jgi:hypothetical protein
MNTNDTKQYRTFWQSTQDALRIGIYATTFLYRLPEVAYELRNSEEIIDQTRDVAGLTGLVCAAAGLYFQAKGYRTVAGDYSTIAAGSILGISNLVSFLRRTNESSFESDSIHSEHSREQNSDKTEFADPQDAVYFLD